jgi:2-keto-4-pentenoate hydratase
LAVDEMPHLVDMVKVLLALGLLSICVPGMADAAEVKRQGTENNSIETPVFLDALQWQSAYQGQKLNLDKMLRGRLPEGFKAGLTSLASQRRFHSDRPIMGVLCPGAKLDSTEIIKHSDFRQGMLEVELAFRLKRTLEHKVADVVTLKTLLDVVAPAAELPDLGFQSQKPPTVFDIVRANVAAHRFVVGTPVSMASIDPEAITIGLHIDDQVIYSAQSSTLIDGQLGMLLKLINDRIDQGWVIYPDQWLLTGAIGPIRPLEIGRYSMSFGDLGELSLLVEP